MDNVQESLEISDKISSGKISSRDGATAILNLIHINRAEAQKSMADALWNANKNKQAMTIAD